jgi:hypothetical protein
LEPLSNPCRQREARYTQNQYQTVPEQGSRLRSNQKVGMKRSETRAIAEAEVFDAAQAASSLGPEAHTVRGSKAAELGTVQE